MTTKNNPTRDTLEFLEHVSGSKLTLGKAIHSIRLCDELSQVEFAHKLGISKQQLCDIEHNRKILSPKLAAKYATLLGYPNSQFIRLALQGIIDRDNLNVIVEIKSNNFHTLC